jgi:hypothetical protein
VICEIAVATNTHPGPWWQESEETVLTVLDILADQHAALTKTKRKRRG